MRPCFPALRRLIPVFFRNCEKRIYFVNKTDEKGSYKPYPIYREMAYIDRRGFEKIRIVDGRLMPPNALRNVSVPENTNYFTETYFEQTKALPAGRVYISPVLAWHTSVEYQLAGDARMPEVSDAVRYTHYESVIRFATPIYTQSGAFDGIVILSMDHRHIMEPIIHTNPASEDEWIEWAAYDSSGNYAYMWDAEGYLIAHPVLSRLRGLDANGRLISPITLDMDDEEKNRHPFNMLHGYPEAREMYDVVRSGKSGFTRNISLSGVRKGNVFAPVTFHYGKLQIIFGGIAIGVSLEEIHKAANIVRQNLGDEYKKLDQTIKAKETSLKTFMLWIIALAVFVLISIATLVSRSIARPLKLLSTASEEIATGNLDAGIPSIKAIDEVAKLADSFVHMTNSLKIHIKELTETTAVKERMESELNVARSIQLGSLPKLFPPFPDRKEFDLYAYLEPAKEVGGDLYDFFFVDDDHLCFTVGDVSDKGIPAALFMVITRALIRNLAQRDLSPADIMTQINKDLCTENYEAMFVTLFLGILDIRTGKLLYANGGHNPPIVIPRKKGVFYIDNECDIAVAAWDYIQYKEFSFTLEPGEALFLYTDGVTEAENPERKLFSDENLLAEVEINRDRTVEDIVNTILLKVREHAGTAPQSDDIAMMVIRYNGNAGGNLK